jgi:hypothetical protein
MAKKIKLKNYSWFALSSHLIFLSLHRACYGYPEFLNKFFGDPEKSGFVK